MTGCFPTHLESAPLCVLADQARALNPWWTFAVEHQRPFVTWKAATSLDGRVAAADGSSRWITSAAARTQVHTLRSDVDAVVVGTGTVLADDPSLTARGVEGPVRQPARVVFDSLARLPLTFAEGAREATGALALPPELRNRISRFEIAGVRSAGAVSLTDDSLKRRKVALIAGSDSAEALQLLSPTHYLRQALDPVADHLLFAR